jgi:flagellar hook-basal body complex protein FliE
MTIGADEVMLLEDYQTAMEELQTVQEAMLAAGTPSVMDPDVIAAGDEALKRLMESVDEFSASQEEARVAVESFASGIANLGADMAGAFLQGDISAMKIGSTIRNVVIGAIKDMIAAFLRAKVVMAGLRLFGLPFAEGGAVPMAHGGGIPRAANGYSIPDGQRGMDSRLILGMPGEEVINRSLSRRLDRFISAYEMGAAVSPFALAGAGGGGGNVINFNVGRPVSVLDALDMGRSAVTASRKYSEASL